MFVEKGISPVLLALNGVSVRPPSEARICAHRPPTDLSCCFPLTSVPPSWSCLPRPPRRRARGGRNSFHRIQFFNSLPPPASRRSQTRFLSLAPARYSAPPFNDPAVPSRHSAVVQDTTNAEIPLRQHASNLVFSRGYFWALLCGWLAGCVVDFAKNLSLSPRSVRGASLRGRGTNCCLPLTFLMAGRK